MEDWSGAEATLELSAASDPTDEIVDRDVERVRQAFGVYTRSELAALMHCGVSYIRALERLAGLTLNP